jgi:hypothetical protein
MELTVALEPSGTYGDALRQGLHDHSIATHRVSPKAAHDHAETFDGVPSQHDGKDAAVVAELCVMGKSRPWAWREPEEWEQELGYQVDCLDAERRLFQMWCGRLEGRLARHWPEVTRRLKPSGPTLLKMVYRYGSAAHLSADPGAASQLKAFGGKHLQDAKITQVISEASCSRGIRPTPWDCRRMQELAGRALDCRRAMNQARRRLSALTAGHPRLGAMSGVVGVGSACCCGTAAAIRRPTPARRPMPRRLA